MLFFTLIAAMAQWEREEIASRIISSNNVRAKLGRPLNGSAPFGYQWKDKKMVPHPEEKVVRKLIYELFDHHKRLKRVSKELNARGLRTRKGLLWSDTSVRNLIEDPTAKGEHRAQFTQLASDGKNYSLKPQDQWVISPVEAVVSPELWQQCNDVLTARKGTRTNLGPKPIHLFSGLLYCQCGSKMYVRTAAPHSYLCFKCRNKIEKAALEQAFVNRLKGYFLSPEQITDNLRQANEQLAEKEQLLHALEKEITKVKGESDRLYQLYQDGQIDTKGFGDRYKPLNERLQQLNEELPIRQAEVDFHHIHELSVETVLDEARTLYDVWPKMELEEKRKVVEALVEKLVVGREEIEITLKAAISSEESVKRQSQAPAGFAAAHG
jgi:site-specific DNA recombinase